MTSNKGKGRARGEEVTDQSRADGPQEQSIASRVAASAHGLASSALASPNGNELNQRAAAALANSGKGQASSTGGSSAWAESSRTISQHVVQPSSSNSFRPTQNEEYIRKSENEFSSFLDGIDTFTPSQTLGGRHFGDLDNSFGVAWHRSQPSPNITPSKHIGYQTVAEQELHDGDEVLSMLSAPEDMNVPFEIPEDDEYYDWGLTQEQISQLRAMTKDLLPPPEPHQSITLHNPLNLIPHVDDTDFINANSQAAVDAWRDQWQDVLTRYTDEVWGGLLPLVKEARREVEGLQSGEEPTVQPKALRRLGAILGHLRKY
jgi:hypothetical protein